MTFKTKFYLVSTMIALSIQSQASQPAASPATSLFKITERVIWVKPENKDQWSTKIRFGLLRSDEEIGSASFLVYKDSNKVYLGVLDIDKRFQSLSLGRQLLYHALSVVDQKLPGLQIYWKAIPYIDRKLKTLKRLIRFYTATGAKTNMHEKINMVDLQKTMHYPIRAARMLTVLRPIFQPQIISNDEKMITVGNGKRYMINPHDVLGIIANYIGETNHIDERSHTATVPTQAQGTPNKIGK